MLEPDQIDAPAFWRQAIHDRQFGEGAPGLLPLIDRQLGLLCRVHVGEGDAQVARHRLVRAGQRPQRPQQLAAEAGGPLDAQHPQDREQRREGDRFQPPVQVLKKPDLLMCAAARRAA
ncbi:hypothetical protein D3C87_1778230 [compost metagenome]